MMPVVRTLLAIFGLLAIGCAAQGAQPQALESAAFTMLDPPHATEPGQKVEVMEFFAYYCPHCNALDAPLAEWVKKQGDKVVFKRVHTSITGQPVPQQYLYYALETIGKLDEYHRKILYEIHFLKQPLNTEDEIFAFIQRQGIDRQKFSDAYHSFVVHSKVTRAIRMQTDYRVNTWPTIVLDGRIATSPPIAGAHLDPYDELVAQDVMLTAMNGLVARLYKERNQK